MRSPTSASRPSRAAESSSPALDLLARALEAGSFMLRLAETLTPYAVVLDVDGAPSLVSIDARAADPDELEMQLVGALQSDAADGVIRGAAWAYTIDVKTPDYAGPALKVYVDVQGERPFVAYTPYTFSMGDPAVLGDTHRIDAEVSVLFGGGRVEALGSVGLGGTAPGPKKSVAKKPAAKKPAAKKPAAKKPAAKKPAAKKPAAKKSR